MTVITKNCVATFRYIMRNGRGEMLEDTTKGIATSYLHGGEAIHLHLQEQLEGLASGETKIISLLHNCAPMEDDITFEVIIDEVRAALPAELKLGYAVPLPAEECGEGCICNEPPDEERR
jgi:hypothetical protein